MTPAPSADLSLAFLDVVEQAAIACARTMGRGDRHQSDHVAVAAMRARLDYVPIDGRVVIGEGERDKAPMLFIGERVGQGCRQVWTVCQRSTSPSTRLKAPTCARPVHPARSRYWLLRSVAVCSTRPTSTWRSSSWARRPKGAVSLDASVADNLTGIAACLDRAVSDLVVVVLERDRHAQLIADIRAAGARIRLIGDGDLTAAIGAAVAGNGTHAVMGSSAARQRACSPPPQCDVWAVRSSADWSSIPLKKRNGCARWASPI